MIEVTEEESPFAESIYEGSHIINVIEPTFDFYDGLDEKLAKIHEHDKIKNAKAIKTPADDDALSNMSGDSVYKKLIETQKVKEVKNRGKKQKHPFYLL